MVRILKTMRSKLVDGGGCGDQAEAPTWLNHIQRASTALGSLTPDKLNALAAGEAFVWSSKATDTAFTMHPAPAKTRTPAGARRSPKPAKLLLVHQRLDLVGELELVLGNIRVVLHADDGEDDLLAGGLLGLLVRNQ